MSDHQRAEDGTYQQRFLRLAESVGALRFGEFELKSGRTSPYFFNAGAFDNGAALAELGDCYADAIIASGVAFDMLFGPAYKGIPLVAAIAIALAARGRNHPYCFNRKEAKDHGEGGSLVGAALAGRVLIVDDVITAGTAIRESVQIITAADAHPVGVALALNRQERGPSGRSAVDEASDELGLQVVSVATLGDLISAFDGDTARHAVLKAYRDRFGV